MENEVFTEKKYFTIREVHRVTGVKPHTLRYWESEFKLLRPARRESGQRRYIQRDIDTIVKIKKLLHQQRYSIEGAKMKLREEKHVDAVQPELFQNESLAVSLIKEIKKELLALMKDLQ